MQSEDTLHLRIIATILKNLTSWMEQQISSGSSEAEVPESIAFNSSAATIQRVLSFEESVEKWVIIDSLLYFSWFDEKV